MNTCHIVYDIMLWGRTGFDGDNRDARSESRAPGPRQKPGIKNKR
jgi:hypothetical protein